MNLEEIKSRINPIYADAIGTESYERRWLVGEIEALRQRAEAMEVEFQRQREAYAQMVSGLEVRNDVLLAMMKEMAEALEKLAKLGNGDSYGNSVGNSLALDALAKYKEVTK